MRTGKDWYARICQTKKNENKNKQTNESNLNLVVIVQINLFLSLSSNRVIFVACKAMRCGSVQR